LSPIFFKSEPHYEDITTTSEPISTTSAESARPLDSQEMTVEPEGPRNVPIAAEESLSDPDEDEPNLDQESNGRK